MQFVLDLPIMALVTTHTYYVVFLQHNYIGLYTGIDGFNRRHSYTRCPPMNRWLSEEGDPWQAAKEI